MKLQLENRLKQLETEYKKGEERLQALEAETNNVKSSMLRISGAIQVLKEELEKVENTSDNGAPDTSSLLESTEEG